MTTVYKKLPKRLQSCLTSLSKGLKKTLQENLVGIYIHGSLTYGGYVRERSDIDVLVLIEEKLVPQTRLQLDTCLKSLSQEHSVCMKNIELDILLLSDLKQKHTVLNSTYTFRGNHPNGNKILDGFWIELSNTRDNGITLFGPKPTTIIPKVDKEVLIQSNKEKFLELQKRAEMWEKINLWNQIYILVQASRVLYSLSNELRLTGKQDALAWATENAPKRFTAMLNTVQTKLDKWEGPREKVVTKNWKSYFEYVSKRFKD